MAAVIELSCRRDVAGGAIWIDVHATCGLAGRQTQRDVASVIEPENVNPGVRLHREVVALNLLGQIVEFVRSRPWEEGGPQR